MNTLLVLMVKGSTVIDHALRFGGFPCLCASGGMVGSPSLALSGFVRPFYGILAFFMVLWAQFYWVM
jgi:hypothetical protein